MKIRGLGGKAAGIVILAGLMVSFAVANTGDISWQAVGPGGGGSWQGFAIDPNDPLKVLAGSDIGGIYRSIDGGTTWTNANAGSMLDPDRDHHYWVESFAYNRQDSTIVYAGGPGSLYKSTDAGVTWTFLTPPSPAVVWRNPSVVAVDPSDGNYVYAASGSLFGNSGNGCFFKSTNAGASFTAISLVSPAVDCTLDFDPAKPNAFGIVINPAGTVTTRTMLVTTSKGLFKSTNSGATWTNLCSSGSCPASLPASHIDFGGITYDPTGQAVYLVMHTKIAAPQPGEGWVDPNSWAGGVYRSTDWGTSWTKVNGTEGSNLATNGTFDTAGSPASGWTYFNDNGTLVKRVKVQGNWVIQIQTPDVNHGAPGIQSNMIPVTGGARLLVHARAKATITNYKDPQNNCCEGAFFGRIWFYNASGQDVADDRCYSQPPDFYSFQNLFASSDMSTGWRDYESWYRVPAGATQVKVAFYTSDAQGTTLVDDVVVKHFDSLPRVHDFGGYVSYSYQNIVADPTVAGTLWLGTFGAPGYGDGVWKTTNANTSSTTWTWETRDIDNDNVTDKRANLDPPTPNDPSIGCTGGPSYDPVYGLGIGSGPSGSGHDTLYFGGGYWIYKKPAGSSQWVNVTHDAGETTCTSSTDCPTWIGRGSVNNVSVMDVKMAGTDHIKLFYGDSDNLLLNSQDGGVKFRQEGIRNSIWFWGSAPYNAMGNAVPSIVVETADKLYVSVYDRSLATTRGGILSGCYSTNSSSCVVPSDSTDPNNTWIWTQQGTGFPGGGPARLERASTYLYMALGGTGRGVYRQTASNPLSPWDGPGSIGGDYTTWGNPPTVFAPSFLKYDAPRTRLFVGAGNLYLGDTAANTGVWMNEGLGNTWCKITPLTDVANKPYGEAAASMAVNSSTGELFLGTINVGTGHLGGLYRGTGTNCTDWTWTKVSLNPDPSNHGAVWGVAISPITSQIVYAAVGQENGTPDSTKRAGIYKSVDGGSTFTKLDLNGLTSLRYPLLAYSADGQSNLTLLLGTAGSGAFTGTILTPAVPGLTGEATGSRTVVLDWADNSFAEQGYKIERKQAAGTYAEIYQTGANATEYVDTTPTGGHFFYRMRGFNEAGNSDYSNEIQVIVQN